MMGNFVIKLEDTLEMILRACTTIQLETADILDIVTNVRRCLMTNYKKQTYIIIQEAMVERIRFLEDELYNRAYKDIERQEAEIDRLKEKCVNLMLENADYVWDEMARSAMAKRANTRRWRSRGCI